MSSESLDLWLEESWNQQLALRLRLRGCLHQSSSAFQRIAVYDSHALGRVLALGGRIVLTEHDEPIYSEGLTHPGAACHPDPRRILVLGGGDGGIARELCRYPVVERIVVVEIDREVPEVVRTHLPDCGAAFDDPRVVLEIDDARRYLADQDERWDLIVVDADELADPRSDLVQPVPLADLLQRRLAPGGILVAPLGIPAFAGEACRAGLRDLAGRFAQTRVYHFTTPSMIGHQWYVAWCSQEREPTVVADPEALGPLRFWHPDLQPALFTLPRHQRRQLGLDVG